MRAVAGSARGSRREPSKAPYYVVLVILALVALGPLVVLAFNALKTNVEIGRNRRCRTDDRRRRRVRGR